MRWTHGSYIIWMETWRQTQRYKNESTLSFMCIACTCDKCAMMQTVNIDIWLASERMIKVSKCSPKNPRLPSVRLNKLVIFNNHHLLWKCKYTLPMPSHSVRWAAVQSMCKSAHIINSIIIRVTVFLTLRMLKALASINTEKFDILNKIFDRNL